MWTQKSRLYSYYRFSDYVKYLNTYPKEERKKRLLEEIEIKKLNPISTSIYHTDLLDDYYPNRLVSLERIVTNVTIQIRLRK